MSANAQKEFYNRASSFYANTCQNGNPYFAFVLNRFLSALGPLGGKDVLEMGCSLGRFTKPLLEQKCRLTGVDFSAQSLRGLDESLRTHPLRSNLEIVEDDVCNLSRIQSRVFNVICGAHILHHVADVRAALSRAHSLLVRGGRAVFLEPNPLNPLWYIQMVVEPTRAWEVERGILNVRAAKVKEVFRAAGFVNCSVKSFGFFPPFAINGLPGLTRIEPVLESAPFLARFATLNLFVADKG